MSVFTTTTTGKTRAMNQFPLPNDQNPITNDLIPTPNDHNSILNEHNPILNDHNPTPNANNPFPNAHSLFPNTNIPFPNAQFLIPKTKNPFPNAHNPIPNHNHQKKTPPCPRQRGVKVESERIELSSKQVTKRLSTRVFFSCRFECKLVKDNPPTPYLL